MEQTMAQARRTGTAVEVPGATTATDTLTANPNGTLTLTRSLVPARKLVSGKWVGLDPTLQFDADGSISPRVTTGAVSLSGGGNGPLATLHGPSGASLALGLPVILPKPSLAGNTATYASVLPGVDLQVSVDPQGSLRQVLVVHDAQAAANPALTDLNFSTQVKGVTVSADADGNLTAADRSGRAVFTAPAPTMWDSTPSTGPTVIDPKTKTVLDARTGNPAHSGKDGPGAAAHAARIPVTVGAGRVQLTPDRGMLTDKATQWPVYIDPTWTQPTTGHTRSGYASVSETYSTTKYWNNTADPDSDRLQVGNADGWKARTLVNFPIDLSKLSKASITKATLSMTNVYSYSCTRTGTNIYAPATTLSSSNASWSYWFGSSPVSLGSAVASGSFAWGYSSSCAAKGVSFGVLDGVTKAVAAGRSTQTFVIGPDSDTSGHWKKFSLSSLSLSIEFNNTPDVPTSLTTSPTTSCTANPPTAVGDGDVYLQTTVSDPDQGSLVGARFELWKTSAPGTILVSTDPNDVYASTGNPVPPVQVSESTLKGSSGTAVTQFSWHVQTYDGFATSGWSTTCSFIFDPTRAGAPTVTLQGTPAMRSTVTVSITKPSSGAAPGSYLYQLNSAPPLSVTADSSGNATITVTPTRRTNTLTVTSVSPGGNAGIDSANLVFNATPPSTIAADQDLTGDGNPDLLAVGATNGLPAGLWQAASTTTAGQVNRVATDIGMNGNGITGDLSPTDFTASKAMTGNFTGFGSIQDILVYYPGSNPAGVTPGGGVVLNGTGDGSPLQSQLDGNHHQVSPDVLKDWNGNSPLQLVTAGHAGRLPYSDLLGVVNDPTIGPYLDYYVSYDGIAAWAAEQPLITTTPAGDMNWNDWTITSAQVSTGTALILWKRSTGALYLWTGVELGYDSDNNELLNYTSYTLKTSGWNTNATGLTLQAADLNHDNTLDLWTVGAGGTVTAYLIANVTGTPTVTAQTAQALVTGTHSWKLDDGTTGNVGTAKDSIGTLDLTGSGTAKWRTGDVYSPDVLFNIDDLGQPDTSGRAELTTSPSTLAVDATKSFTVSAWVKPYSNQGTVVSEDGAHSSRFTLYADTNWYFGVAKTDDSTFSYDLVKGPAVQVGVWTNVTGSYNASTGTVSLYVNGSLAATANRSTKPTWPSTSALRIGARQLNNAISLRFVGQIAEVQTGAVVPIGMRNAGFEEPVTGGVIPGWHVLYGPTTAFTVVDNPVNSGAYSVRVVDTSTTQSSGLQSDRFAVTPGQSYQLTAAANIASGTPSMYLYFYDSAGTLLTNGWAYAGATGTWAVSSLTMIAPAGATQAAVMLYSAIANTGTAYFDDVAVYAQP
jgi:hypothetical protein